jgi:hypothetical protein
VLEAERLAHAEVAPTDGMLDNEGTMPNLGDRMKSVRVAFTPNTLLETPALTGGRFVFLSSSARRGDLITDKQ